MEKDKMKMYSFRDECLFILLVFSFGGIFGFLYEELFYYIDLGYLVKRGTTFGPWIPIYGVGAVLIVLSTSCCRFCGICPDLRAAGAGNRIFPSTFL